ncbi:TetR/AcrR family transcriptional regulator [Agreia sp. VKM Ac-1783]|uniref:TetR/AcrR family transcriptional regulator n=1 Tax=Agreia sp. VKM Ac-1783 TaxID=1938889 RepID=UPI000A2AAA27|nr:TetR/AcrR family transcriptional regulator [Agreia sp. VKM Ac-1783]SMQ68304.1 transcriptional regulator, TetR family [Agreia sp. VKM Ac-1783]
MADRGSYAKGVVRREEILTAALDVFSREGYRGTSLRDIAKQVGVSLPGLMHYFDSKEHLLTAILQKRDQVDGDAHPADGDFLDGLLAIMRHNRDVPGLVQLYITLAAAAEDPSHPAHSFFIERFDFVRLALAAVVRDRQAAGTARAELDPEHVARVLIAVADGIQIQWALDRTVDMAGDIERLWDAISR